LLLLAVIEAAALFVMATPISVSGQMQKWISVSQPFFS